MPGKSYLISHPDMEKVGMMIHSGLNVVKCMMCEEYFGSRGISGHMESHAFARKAKDIRAALKVCDDLHIPQENKHCSIPSPDGPPVEGVPIVAGFICRQDGCFHCLTVKKNMKAHQSKKHPGLDSANVKKVFTQALYHVPTRMFCVAPSLEDDQSPTLTAVLKDQILPVALAAPPPILLATDDRGRNPVEKHFGFDLLLGDIRESRTSLALLSELKKRHTADEEGGLYAKLSKTFTTWHSKISRDLNGNPNNLDLERFLIHGDQVPPTGSVPFFSRPLTITHPPFQS